MPSISSLDFIYVYLADAKPFSNEAELRQVDRQRR